MSAPLSRYTYMTFDEFEEILRDKPEDEKWELIGGRLVTGMVGARLEHHLAIDNIGVHLSNHVRAKKLPCRVFRETFWLKDKTQDLSVFPDIMVHCGPVSKGQTAINDPVVLIEVVSKGSEMRDRFEKRGFYQKLPSVAHLVFVALDRPQIELLTRKEDGIWEQRTFETADSSLPLDAISASIPLPDIYAGVADLA